MLATVVLLGHFAAPDSEALAIQMQAELDAVFALSPVRAEIRIESRANNLGTPREVRQGGHLHSLNRSAATCAGTDPGA